jgi:hypothetical protein
MAGRGKSERARGTAALLALLATALLAIGSPAAAAAGAHAKNKHKKPPPPELALAPQAGAAGATVSMLPVGVSLEYPAMALALGSGECPAPALAAELERLGAPPLQLAGQSQDFTVPAASAPAAPQSWEELTSYPLPAEFWTRLHCLLNATHEPLTAGLNVRLGQLSGARQIVSAASAAATNGVGFSLGNEPDLYYLPNYYSLGKPLANEEQQEVATYLRAAQAIRPAVGAAPLTGPELSTPGRWRGSLPGVISSLGLSTLGVHAYPLSVCRTPRAATIKGLLSAGVGAAPARLAWVVADARALGIPAVITEANSVSCGGKAGVSDTRAAAVWAVRFVLSALKTGFAEVRFHFSGDPYDPFYMSGSEVSRRPIEAAMVALNQWLPVGASFRTLPSLRGVAATAIAAPAQPPRLLLDNGTRADRQLVLRGATGIQTQVFSASGAQPLLRPAKGGGHRVLVTIPPGTVLEVAY